MQRQQRALAAARAAARAATALNLGADADGMAGVGEEAQVDGLAGLQAERLRVAVEELPTPRGAEEGEERKGGLRVRRVAGKVSHRENVEGAGDEL